MLDLTIKPNLKDKLIPVIVQDYETNEVLMLAYMNEKALIKTIKTGYTHFWSRSRKKIWFKGEVSGNFQRVKEIYIDCDEDAILIKVKQFGNACHLGKKSCFHRKLSIEKLFKESSVD